MMFFKPFKWATVGLLGFGLAGTALFGRDLYSYVNSSVRSAQAAVKDSVPIEFELRRARDLLDDILPEMQANVRLIATQEVEMESLRRDIDESRTSIAEERARITKLRDALGSKENSFTFARITYTRDQVKDDLARRLEQVKEADMILSGKQRLLSNREKALAAAVSALERTRSQKSLLESQIASLDGQQKLLKATSVGSSIQIDNSKLAQSERLIAQIKKQLDTAERVLAHEAKFTQPIDVQTLSERDVMTQAEEYLAAAKK
jgi:hypothetical protein